MKFRDRVYAPGPTHVPESSRLKLAEANPYHRTPDFSQVIRDTISRLKAILDTDQTVVPVSATGTGAMQMAVDNFTTSSGTSLVVESGKFGERWSNILEKKGHDVIRYEVPWGEAADPGSLKEHLENNSEIQTVYTTLVETSTLVKHPIQAMAEVVPEEIVFVVDVISALGGEPFYPADWEVDVWVGGSQKGLMTPPGLSLIGVSEFGKNFAENNENQSFYFDLEIAIERFNRDQQTPWTPPMNLIRSLGESLGSIQEEGMDNVLTRHEQLAAICRGAVEEIGLDVFADVPTNIGTSVELPETVDASRILETIKQNYGLFMPGGQKQYSGKLIRIGHLGDVDFFDLLASISALELGLKRTNYIDTVGGAVRKAQQLFDKLDAVST